MNKPTGPLSIQVLESAIPEDFHSPRYLQTYQVWKETWSQEYDLVGRPPLTHSDNFTRQSLILSIQVDGACAALSCLHDIDLSTEMGRADSWLEPWPAHVIDKMRALAPKILLWNSFTVSSEFRGKKAGGMALKDLVAAACVYAFEHCSSASVMLGSTRNNKKVNQLLYNVGGLRLDTVDFHGEPTDLISFQKGVSPKLPADVEALLQSSWATRLKNPTRLRAA